MPASTTTQTAAYTRKVRTYEPDDPVLKDKTVARARLHELERIPAEVRDIHRTLLGLFPDQVFEAGFVKQVRELVQRVTEIDFDLWLDSVQVVPRSQLRTLMPGATSLSILGLEPLSDKVVLEVDSRTVYALVDRLLGGRGAAVDVHRPLSDIEQGVFSFLLLKVLHLFQQNMERAEQVAVRLQDMRSDVRECADILRREDHWMVVAWRMNVGLDVSYARALIPVSLARRFSAPEPPAESGLAARRRAIKRSRMGRLAGIRVSGRVVSGHIDFGQEELAALDPGDIVVLEHTGLGLDEDGSVAGHASLLFGTGQRGQILGVVGPVEGQRVFQFERFEAFAKPGVHDPQQAHGEESHPEEVMAEYEHREDELEEASDGQASLLDIVDEDWGLDDEDSGGDEEQYMSEEEAYEAYEDEGYEEVEDGAYEEQSAYEGEGGEVEAQDNLEELEPLLGDMPIHVVVELGRVELTADEVLSLRPGQLIDLGRSPTDPVDLVADGRVIAKGELVEIEGQLGVRIQALAAGGA